MCLYCSDTCDSQSLEQHVGKKLKLKSVMCNGFIKYLVSVSVCTEMQVLVLYSFRKKVVPVHPYLNPRGRQSSTG